MSDFAWDSDKNQHLLQTRGVCFEDVLVLIDAGFVLDVIRHPNPLRYPKQRIIVLRINEYVWLIPYVKRKGERFLKTMIPSRKATREYLT
jgi:uncharacterized DUF497 family protein